MSDVIDSSGSSAAPDLSSFKDSMESTMVESPNIDTKNVNSSVPESNNSKVEPHINSENIETKNKPSSLLDTQVNADSADSSLWKWSENKDGEGPKPAWMRENFKSVEEQAKAYGELVKKFGSFEKAPEAYDINGIENAQYQIVNGDKNFEQFKDIAKEMNMSQDGLSKIVKFFNEKVAPTFKPESQAINFEEEAKKLGDNWQEKLGILSQWSKNHIPQKAEQFKNMIKTAEDAQVLLDILEKVSGEVSIPDSQSMGWQNSVNESDLKSELATSLKDRDPDKFRLVQQKYEKLFG